MEIKLETDRIRLRRFNRFDFENMRILETDPDVMKFIPKRVVQSPEQTQESLEKLIAKTEELHPLGVWAAEFKADNAFVGWFMLNKTDLEFPEIGFMIPKKCWGQGITLEVGKLLISYAFNHLGIQGISARTDDKNQASIRVLEKLGLSYIETKNNDQGDLIKIFRLKK